MPCRLHDKPPSTTVIRHPDLYIGIHEHIGSYQNQLRDFQALAGHHRELWRQCVGHGHNRGELLTALVPPKETVCTPLERLAH